MKRSSTSKPRNFTVSTKKVSMGSARNPAAPSIDWYTKPASELHEHVWQRVRNIKNQQTTRRFENFRYKQSYESRFGPDGFSSLFSPGNRSQLGQYLISINVIKSCIDTACARISKSKPRAFVLPNTGDSRLKRKAKNLTKFLDGAFVAANVYANADEVFRDSCIYDQGALLLDVEDGELKSHVVKVDELWIDQVDGVYNKPTEMHWVHAVPRTELLAKYPDHEKEIEDARSAWRGEMSYMSAADMVEVVRSWRLPSKPGGSDGRYTISIATATLKDVAWAKDFIPIYRFHWTTPLYGCFGDGIAKELFAIQQVITDILRGIVKSIRMFAIPRVWVSKLAGVATQAITNEISVNTYQGEKPVFDTPQAASPDIYQFLQWLIDNAYKQLGLSQLSAQSEKPAGVNAAVAMRTFQDIETQRFSIVGQRWERWYLDVALGMIDLASDLYKDKGKLSVQVAGRGFVETINWKDVSLKADQYDIQIYPTNILPNTPEGRLQTIQEYVSSGFMPFEVAIGQLNLPILNDWVDQVTAARDNVDMCLSSILEKGKYIAPDAVGDVDLAVKISQAAYLNAHNDDTEPHKVTLLLRFMNRALELQAQKNAPPPAPPGPPGGGAAVGQAAPPPPAPLAPTGSGPVSMPAAA